MQCNVGQILLRSTLRCTWCNIMIVCIKQHGIVCLYLVFIFLLGGIPNV